MKFRFTFWKLVFAIIMVLGGYATVIRFTQGLGAATNMSDQYPWGIWIGFDVLCGVMLAAGGFTLTGAVHLLNIKRLEPIVRPTVLTAFSGYLLVSVALMFDLGRPYRIWHPLVMRNPHSVMFEVAMCVMCYTTVLALEFSPIVLERFHLTKPLKFVKAALIPLVILGCILSTLHQSSLGTMYLIMPEKLHPFWYSPLLPVFFFISAIAVGLAMTIFESSISSRVFGRQLELPIIQELGRILLVVLSVYGILRFEDLYHRGVLRQAFIRSIRDLLLLAGDFPGVDCAAGVALHQAGAQQPGRPLSLRRADRAGIHHQPAERQHYRNRTLGRPPLCAQLDGVLGDGSHGRRRLRFVRAGGEVSAHFRGRARASTSTSPVRAASGGTGGAAGVCRGGHQCRRLNQIRMKNDRAPEASLSLAGLENPVPLPATVVRTGIPRKESRD